MSKQRVFCVFLEKAAPEIRELAEACLRFTPQVAVREGEPVIFLEAGRSLRIFTEAGLLMRLAALCERFGLKPRIAVAGDAGAALALARLGARDARSLPLGALADYASPFHALSREREPEAVSALERLIVNLERLGLRTLEDFSKLPPGTLASRFGEEGVELSAMIRGSFARPWPTFRPAEKIAERATLCDAETLGACASLDALLFVLKGLADRAMARLRGRGERAARVSIEMELDDAAKRAWEIELPLPQGSAQGLLPILRDRLAFELDREPLAAPAVVVEFTVLETAPGHGAQRNFFSRQEEEAEAWDALVSRLLQKLGQKAGQKLGRERAFVALPVDRHLPEKAWRACVPAMPARAPVAGAVAGASDEAAPPAPRPARVLPSPEPLRRDGDLLLMPSPRGRARRWRVLEWHGPERISGEWWLDDEFQGFSRDYYRVVTHTGEQLWVFSGSATRERPRSFFLHGYFD